jgi:hypothetical protein
MDVFSEYAEKQRGIMRKAEKGIRSIGKLAYNWDRMYSPSDAKMRINNCNNMGSAIRPTNGAASSDLVYKKICEAEKVANGSDYSNKFYKDSIAIQEKSLEFRMKMERRKGMTEEEYLHIQDIPLALLLREWSR